MALAAGVTALASSIWAGDGVAAAPVSRRAVALMRKNRWCIVSYCRIISIHICIDMKYI
jgi:hypothetical protein